VVPPGATPNDIHLAAARELVLLGGANMGGKTTYLRTAGALQILFQLGLPVPAARAAISPASGVFAVFSRAENTELNLSKLGRELTDLRDAVAGLDENGLFLGNEPITATSPAESLILSREALCALKAKGARGLWVTHLYELFDDAGRLNGVPLGGRIEPMHAEGGGGFAIRPGPPTRRSGAREVYAGGRGP